MRIRKFSIFLFLLFTLFFSLYKGPVKLTLEEILNGSPIFWQVRLPRTVHALIVGASLAISGSVLQAVFRNPLAEPYFLGISSGAAVGAAISTLLKTNWSLELTSFIGAILSFLLVYKVSVYNGFLSTERLLLSGIGVSAFLSALIGFLLYFKGNDFHGLLFWLWGNLGISSWNNIIRITPVLVISSIFILRYSQELNLILWGDEHASQMGVDSIKIKKELVILSSLLAAVSVSSSGIIGFVGLVIPHMVRLVISPDHRKLLPFSALLGGSFLLFTDTMARILIPPIEIPVGIITALLGSPFFIYLLIRGKNNASS
ncbi:MAG: iron ABC transporter permease [Synergistetes bacterium]|nr:iron ABC transporter permease [Synergistota bacterium]MCX8128113.1 iron ABC transporter permease [Synergistota bacterium]MDW8192489.1 iron chelate uptake ABC transporter family permease subunit [Synergistota bacterium]